MITFAKHGDGWCLKGPAGELQEGAAVWVTKKDGSKKECKVGRFIANCDKGVVKFEEDRSEKQSGRGQSQSQAAPQSNAVLESLALVHRKLDSILDVLYPGTAKPDPAPLGAPTDAKPDPTGGDIPF